MSKFNELTAKLREIFQIDRPELDFGIYRILNARAGEINHYLEQRLPEKVKQALSAGSAAQQAQVTQELKDKEAQYQADGIDPATVPKVKELREKLAQYTTGANEHENAVFSHLLAFFSRYYDNGDFISQRRYKGDTYARRILAEEARDRGVKILLEGESRVEIDALPVFELLPFVLLENGVKYSPRDQTVTVAFDVVGKQQIVIISSIGPTVSDEELPHLFEKGYRGGQTSNLPGDGLGLFLAKQVCGFHGVKIRAETGRRNLYQMGGISYSEFRVVLQF